jgi:hypothetical protein
LKKLLLHEYTLVFLFCLAAVHGAAFSMMDNFDLGSCVDCKTYMGLAELDLNQSPIRRYRPIVPALAGIINYLCGGVFKVLQPTSFNGDFGLAFSFYLVNCVIMSLWGVVIYRFGRAWGLQRVFALAGTLVMLTCRWTPYIAGTPLADSLYCLVVGMALLGIQTRNERMTVAAIIIGPFAKEAFIFIAPVIFLFSHMKKVRLVGWLALSGVLVFGFRYVYDRVAGLPVDSGLAADVDHFNYIIDNSRRLLSFHGAYDVLSNVGIWLVFPLMAWRVPGYRVALRGLWRPYIIMFMLSILLHMVLSSSFERMFFLTMPVLCAMVGLAVENLYMRVFGIEK